MEKGGRFLHELRGVHKFYMMHDWLQLAVSLKVPPTHWPTGRATGQPIGPTGSVMRSVGDGQ